MNQSWMQAVTTAQTAGSTLSASVANTTILPTSALFTFPANFFTFIGQKWHLKAYGQMSNIVTTPGTITFNFQFGAVVVATSGALQMNAVAKTNVSWYLDMTGTIRALGSGTSTNNIYFGNFQSESYVGSPVPGTGGSGSVIFPTSAPVVSAGWDCTVTQQANLFAQFSVNNAGNSITLLDYVLEATN